MTVNPLRVVGWWLRDYAYVSVGQFRAVTSACDPASFGNGTGRVIVIIPGFIETWQFMLPLIRTLHGRGHPVHVVADVGWNVRSETDAAHRVSAYLLKHDLRDVLLVTHSKGGMIGKRVMSLGAGASRVAAMVAIAGPFGGSRHKNYRFAPRLGVFSPSNAGLRALSKHAAVNDRIVSIFGRYDPHILGGSFLAGAKNVRLDTGGHFRVIEHPIVLREIVAATATCDAVSCS